MDRDQTVEGKKRDEAADMAPTPARMPATQVGDSMTVPPDTNQHFFDVEPTRKRGKTMGEHVFNISTYGGFALVANEALSTVITHSADHGRLHSIYAPFKRFFTEQNVIKDAYVKGGRLPYILFAVIGGMFTVFPIKWLEDNKGACVRFFDRHFYGNRADTDPKIREAHAEMDKAPHQSWGSLWKGRILTVASALTLDYFTGHKDAPSAKWLENTGMHNYRSMEHAAETVADKIVKPTSIFRHVLPAKWVGPQNKPIVQRGLFLLTLSTTLTLLFYASSKMFARLRARSEREEQKAEQMQAQSSEQPKVKDRTEPETHRPLPSLEVSEGEVSRLQPATGREAMAGLP